MKTLSSGLLFPQEKKKKKKAFSVTDLLFLYWQDLNVEGKDSTDDNNSNKKLKGFKTN